jgi:hypothetical protein
MIETNRPTANPTQYKLLRDITGQQFAEAIEEVLGPRMKVTGESATCMYRHSSRRLR